MIYETGEPCDRSQTKVNALMAGVIVAQDLSVYVSTYTVHVYFTCIVCTLTTRGLKGKRCDSKLYVIFIYTSSNASSCMRYTAVYVQQAA